MKKTLALFMALCLTLMLCACGAGTAEGTETTPASENATVDNEDASADSAADDTAPAEDTSADDTAPAEESAPEISEAAQIYPDRTITWYTQGAGNVADIIARIVGKHLGEELGQTVVFENLPGAGGMSQMNPVLANEADGYSIASLAVAFLCMTPFSADCPFTYEDFEMLHCVMRQPQFMVVRSDAPYDTFEEWKAYVEENPDQFRFGVPNASSVHNFCLAGLQLESGLDYNTVVYSTAEETVAALLGGHIEGLVLGFSEAKGSVESGDFKILAFTTEQKEVGYEEYPSLAELGYEARGVAFQGICIKAGTDPDVKAKLVAALDKVFADPAVIEEMTTAGIWYEGTMSGPNEFSTLVKDTYEYYEQVLTETGLMEELYG